MDERVPEAGAACVVLRSNLDLTAAGPLKDELLALRGREIRIDALGVDRLGGLCLQVVLAAQITWVSDAVPFAIGDRSPAFDAALATLGATRFFPLPNGVSA